MLVGVPLAISTQVVAETFKVPAGGDIQSAIDQATDGDIVQLSPGTYRPATRLDIVGKSIQLLGTADESGFPTSVIDGQILNQHLYISGGRGDEVVIARIEFRFGHGNANLPDGNGGSTLIAGCKVLIQDSMFRQNFITGGSPGTGGAIHCDPGSDLDCSGCWFWDNGKCCTTSSGRGGAISSREARLTLTSSVFQGNFASVGGAVYTTYSELVMIGCDLTANGIPVPNTGGGGAVLVYQTEATFQDCTFRGNAGEAGGALGAWDLCNVHFERCQFLDNGSPECHWCRGDAISLNGSSSNLHIRDCDFRNHVHGISDVDVSSPSSQYPGPYVFVEGSTFEDCCPIASTAGLVDLGGNVIDYNCDSCPGDIDCNQLWPSQPKQTNSGDLGLLLERWGTRDPICDIDGDGIVGSSDLGILLTSWGPCPN